MDDHQPDQRSSLGLHNFQWSPKAAASPPNNDDELSLNLFGESFDITDAPHNTDIALPELQHDHDHRPSMSPIKVSFSSPSTSSNPLSHPGDFGPNRSEAKKKALQNHTTSSTMPIPFRVIRKSYRAFAGVKYKLSCLHGMNSVMTKQQDSSLRGQRQQQQIKKAIRRVEAAICAFGGTLHERHLQYPESIFRFNNPKRFDHRRYYEHVLHERYDTSGSQLEWHLEESPPVPTTSAASSYPNTTARNENNARKKLPLSDKKVPVSQPQRNNGGSKIKYKCKLCGLPKNNHVCPYRHPLQRSIGVMVYPAINSFTAAEPGTFAPPLTKMNNFVSYDSEGKNHPKRTESAINNSPEGDRSASYHDSPQSSLSTNSNSNEGASNRKRSLQITAPEVVENKEVLAPSAKKSLLMSSVKLKPEHYRSVTLTKSPRHEEEEGLYQYPPIPLTLKERKNLSDTLFVLSKEIPTMTQECALVLRKARANQEWDVAVAELMAQLVVGMYCRENDISLEGLCRYMFTLGISC